tara:strand:+ start:2335 stop:2505 length:171 start_codon:yes stop_codon:yes gene_type:complete
MTWKVKSEHYNVKFPNRTYCLGELNQKQIKVLPSEIRNKYFIEDKPKKKKKYDLED